MVDWLGTIGFWIDVVSDGIWAAKHDFVMVVFRCFSDFSTRRPTSSEGDVVSLRLIYMKNVPGDNTK